jgi:hypothetical protein
MLKYTINRLREYIFIFLTATIFFLFLTQDCFSEEDVFVINNIEIKEKIEVNFSRNKYINMAFKKAFQDLMPKILLSKDLKKANDIKMNKIKYLINSFQIVEEKYSNNEYNAVFKVSFNEFKVKKFLGDKNISFTESKKISAIFFPILFINDEIEDFYNNFFYKHWDETKIENELINFILPIEDLDDIFIIKKMKNKIEKLNLEEIVNKYDTKNYVFALIDYNNKKLKIYLKTNLNSNESSKNISYKIDTLENEDRLNFILRDVKMKITDIWKQQNLVNISIPLVINVNYNYKNLKDLDKLKSKLKKITIIDQFFIDELSIKDSFFKIYYYGNPKNLKTELFNQGYILSDSNGKWGLYNDE